MLKHIENPSTPKDSYLDEVFNEHREIFNAFKNKDIEAGRIAMANHMDCARDRYIKRRSEKA